MDRRSRSKSSKVRRLASVKSKKKGSFLSTFVLPTATYELEDALLSQLQVADVLHNCVLGENPSMWSIGEDIGGSTTSLKKKSSYVYHRCYHDTSFVPLWHAFSMLDMRSTGQALLGRLMHLSASLAQVLGDDHKDVEIQKHFAVYTQVPFSQYKRYVLDTTSHRHINCEHLSALCWELCKQRYFNNPMVDGSDSVVPAELSDALYYLFCIFNKLTEPGTYPPMMDYEEVELLLRKLFACLGLPWTPSHEEPNNDEADKDSDFQSNSSIQQLNFQQLLSIIADMVGVEMTRSPTFHRAVQRLCLIEYQEVVKAGWLTVRREEHDTWKKRWGVLQRSKLTFYDTILCQVVKEEIDLQSNMQVEMLPGTSSHKHRFRIVEKEGFNISREFEFSTSSSTSVHSWITILNISIRILESGMSPKTAEISERRLERYKRRESQREVHKKKKDFRDTYQRLEEAKKCRVDIMERLTERSRTRQMQMDFLEKLNQIYERLEAIQFEKSLIRKEEREKEMSRLLSHYEERVREERVVDDDCWRKPEDSKIFEQLDAEQTQLEADLQDLQQTSISITYSELPSINFLPPKRSESLDHNSYSSSEHLSTASHEVAARPAATSDVTLPSASRDVARPSFSSDVTRPSESSGVIHPSGTSDGVNFLTLPEIAC